MAKVVVPLAVLAIGAAAWLLLGSRPETGSTVDGDRPASPAPSDAGGLPALAARDGAAGVPRGGSVITGTVRREGQPVAARIQVSFLESAEARRESRFGTTAYLYGLLFAPAKPEPPSLAADAGADGRYAVASLAPGTYRLSASTADGARGSATASLRADGARAVVDLVVEATGETLRGRIVHADGRPFAGSLFVENESPDRTWWETPTVPATPLRPDGRFEATGLSRGDVVLIAVESGSWRSASRAVSVPRADEFVWTLDGGLSLRRGRVLAEDGDVPIAGATVMGGGRTTEASYVLCATTTDARGEFEIRLPTDGGGLRALAAGFAPERKPLSELPLAGEPIEFRLARAARLVGRVTAAGDGHPVAGVSVTAISDGGADQWFRTPPATTDGAGRYELEGLAPGETLVLAEGNGWAAKGIADTDMPGHNPLLVELAAGETTEWAISVVRAVPVAGRVLDASGAPLAGAVVRAEGCERGGGYSWSNPVEQLEKVSAATGPDGAFEFASLVEGASYILVATAPDGAQSQSEVVTASGETRARVEIRFAPERRVEVTVLDGATGAGVAGARVWVGTPGLYFPSQPEPTTTGADGRAVVTLRSVGEAELSVTAEGYAEVRYEPLRATDTSPVVRLSRGHALTGRVLLPDGSPAVGADVSAEVSEAQGRWGMQTGADGTFRFAYGSPGPVTVFATLRPGGRILEAVAVGTRGGDPLVLVLAPRAEAKPAPGTFVVRVVDGDGKPVPRAEVRLEGRSGWDREDVEEGRADFTARTPTESWVSVWNARGVDGTPLPLGPARVGPLAADAQEVVVRLPPERRVDGFVRAPDGIGVRGVSVRASFNADKDGRDVSVSARTDATGAFRIGGLGDACTLTVDVPPEFVRPDPVEVKGGATGVEIRLRAAVQVQITVLDATGKPVPDAWVIASLGGRVQASSAADARTDSNGVARLGSLSPDEVYELEVSGQSRGGALPFTEERWKPADLTVRLERSLHVKGVVRDPSGKPVEGADVVALTDDTVFSVRPTGADGAFEIDGLPAGTVVLRASIGGGKWGGSDAGVRVAVGSEDVVLTIDPGLPLTVRVENWPAGEHGDAALVQQDGGHESRLSGRIASDGSVAFRGVKAGTSYVLWIPPSTEGLSLLLRDVRAGSAVLPVRLVPGKSITGRLTVPAGAEVRGIAASMLDGGVRARGSANPDGTFEIRGLPEGAWAVAAWATLDEAWLRAEAVVVAGGKVDLELK